MLQDVRRGQPEHSVPLETQRTSRSTAWQKIFALTRRHDTAQRALRTGDRRPVPQRGDDQRQGAPLARRRGTRRPSPQVVGQAAPELELQEARHVRERAPQP